MNRAWSILSSAPTAFPRRRKSASWPALLLSIPLALNALEEEKPSLAFMDARELARHCRAPAALSDARLGVCLGYIAGAIDQMVSPQPSAQPKVCPPRDAPLKQLREDFLVYVEANPRELGDAASVVLRRVVEMSYPCP